MLSDHLVRMMRTAENDKVFFLLCKISSEDDDHKIDCFAGALLHEMKEKGLAIDRTIEDALMYLKELRSGVRNADDHRARKSRNRMNAHILKGARRLLNLRPYERMRWETVLTSPVMSVPQATPQQHAASPQATSLQGAYSIVSPQEDSMLPTQQVVPAHDLLQSEADPSQDPAFHASPLQCPSPQVTTDQVLPQQVGPSQAVPSPAAAAGRVRLPAVPSSAGPPQAVPSPAAPSPAVQPAWPQDSEVEDLPTQPVMSQNTTLQFIAQPYTPRNPHHHTLHLNRPFTELA